jgi:uncharacterized Zn-finger protein
MTIHTGDKNHRCKICIKTFSHRGNLITHMTIHTGEKNHVCDISIKAFS